MRKIVTIIALMFATASIAQERKYTLVFDEKTVSGILDWLKNASKLTDGNSQYIGINDSKYIIGGANEVSRVISEQVKPQLDSFNRVDSMVKKQKK